MTITNENVTHSDGYCCYCRKKWSRHPKCRICGIGLHRKEYPCPECGHPHTLSITGRTCVECSLTEDLRISVITEHNNKIINKVFDVELLPKKVIPKAVVKKVIPLRKKSHYDILR